MIHDLNWKVEGPRFASRPQIKLIFSPQTAELSPPTVDSPSPEGQQSTKKPLSRVERKEGVVSRAQRSRPGVAQFVASNK